MHYINCLVKLQLALLLTFAQYVDQADGNVTRSHLSSFQTAVNKPEFVDKSMLLEYIIAGPKVTLVTAPRGFGKTTNLDMIKTYISIPLDSEDAEKRKQIFYGLKIYKKMPEYVNATFGILPVVHVDLKCSEKVFDYNQAKEILRFKIHRSYLEHEYLRRSVKLTDKEKELCLTWCDEELCKSLEDVRIDMGLRELSQYLYKHHMNSPVYLLVDEYDSIINQLNTTVNEELLPRVFKLLNRQLLSLTKDRFIGKAFITGISCVTDSRDHSSFKVYTFLEDHPLISFFGFMETEVNSLFANPLFKLTKAQIEDAKFWYDGYICRKGWKIFNPVSITEFLHCRSVDSYWVKSGEVECFDNVFVYPSIRTTILGLLKDNLTQIEYIKSLSLDQILQLKKIMDVELNYDHNITSLYFSYLFNQGYLCFSNYSEKSISTNYYIKIPNKEVWKYFLWKVQDFTGHLYYG